MNSRQRRIPEHAERKGGKGALWYCLSFVIAQLAVLLACVVISAHPWFLTHDAYPSLRSNLGYGLRARGLNCDIVLYGDSTAMTGLDPAIVQARTGLKSCNVAESGFVDEVVGSNFPLDQYLAHNSRPRFIYTQWAAADFDPETKPWTGYGNEGIEYALLYDRGAWLWKGLLLNPKETIKFSMWAGQLLIEDLQMRLTGKHKEIWAKAPPARDESGGLWRIQSSPETHCDLVAPVRPLVRQHVIEEIAAFKRRYSVQGTRVLVNVSPVAECVINRQELLQATSGLADNPLEFLPVRLFTQNDIHFVPEGSRLVSSQAADQILAIMRQEETGTPSPRDTHPRPKGRSLRAIASPARRSASQ